MTWIHFMGAAAAAAALILIPGWAVLRLCGVSQRIAWGAAPAATAGVLGTGAVVSQQMGLPWSLLTAGLSTLTCIGLVLLARLAASRAAGPEPDRPSGRRSAPPRSRIHFAATCGALLTSGMISVLPVLLSMPGPDAVLQRWDALFHLTAVEHVRETGDGSTLTLGTIAFSFPNPSFYPAAFHDIAALVPTDSTLLAVNATAIVGATVPWALGSAALAHRLWPRVTWAPTAAACFALLAPAAPLSEWVHLSPTSNLIGFSALPGALALIHAAYSRLVAAGPARRGIIAHTAAVAMSLVGIALLHPNVLITLCLLVAIATAAQGLQSIRRGARPAAVLVIPLLAAAPILAIALLPGSEVAGSFTGGLRVPGWKAVGELGLGLLTVWPMAIGVGLWALAWTGAYAFARRGSWIPLLCITAIGVLYLDAALDSSLGLSRLWYRGQDRLSMPLTMLAVQFAIAGTAHLWTLIRRLPSMTWQTIVIASAVVTSSILIGWSVPARIDNANLNFALDRTDRNRFFDTEEWAMLRTAASTLDSDGTLLASPFSGGSHLFAAHGQQVRFGTAGHALRNQDLRVLAAAEDPTAPNNCEFLRSEGVRYIYVDSRAYNVSHRYDPLLTRRIDGLEPIAKTQHSALYELTCG
ncbi:DUF6541 family protein [Helcobacillus massiliensis]|uniref:YfhO family protein n=1 Tax=Helcobacillus massiliensis TaxID=521392 RepID=A0A839QPQ1_9MICO|nr:DUF6541 family protein [Helcobacillus massiliensis]MBB3021962.1 hypothetical protein [Helcobacillus massiliensis]